MKTKLGSDKTQKSTHQSLTKPFGKKFMSLVLCICMLTAMFSAMLINVSAATSGTCGDNLTWTLDDNGMLTISGTGDMPMWNSSGDVPWCITRENIKAAIIQGGVTSIGAWTFDDCENLTNISIPESITSIGKMAFYNCQGLTGISIPVSVTSIGEWAFSYCENLKDVYYTGSEEQWENISIGDGNYCLTKGMRRTDFDNGMRKGIEYFNREMYYEARDEFQWFCDANWGVMNEGQQQYALDYLNGTKEKISEYQKLQQTNFDNGMRKGIEYFDREMYYEARDEFQWFCDANWDKMTSYQRYIALSRLDAVKQKIVNMENPYNVFNGNFKGGGIPIAGGAYIGQWYVSLSNTKSDSMVFSISWGESGAYVDDVFLTRQSNGSYIGESGKSYFTVWIENENRIAVTVEGAGETTGTNILYRYIP